MRICVACETSGVVRRAFRDAGHDAWSVDLRPSIDDDPQHVVGDALALLRAERFDLVIAHPPCTYLCNASSWALRMTPINPTPGVLYGPERWAALRAAAEFFNAFLRLDVPRLCVENPIMHKHARDLVLARATQTVQPYRFGANASKATALWLRGLPKLQPTDFAAPRMVNGAARWDNQTDSGQNKEPDTRDRWLLRSRTFPEIARAMAAQWTDANLAAHDAEHLPFGGLPL